MKDATNATKAAIISVVNAILGLMAAFDVALTQTQKSAVLIAINAGLGLWIALTYKNSAKRIPDK